MATSGKVIVVGDAGVGKTAFCHLICRGEPMKVGGETIGANVDVKYHRDSFVEFFDIGGSERYASCRSMFYKDVHGIILVHDLTNKVSYRNLKRWLREVSGGAGAGLTGIQTGSGTPRKSSEDYDPESFADRSSVPTLIVGTKVDEMPRGAWNDSLASEIGAASLTVNSYDKSQAATTRPTIESFLDLVQDYAKGPSTRRRVQDISHQSRW